MAILHVDDQAAIRDVVSHGLAAFGFAVVSADGVGAAKAALAERPDLAGALIDIRLRDGSGVALYEWIAAHRPALASHVAFVTGSAVPAVIAALATRGCPVLEKPFELAELARLAGEWEAAPAHNVSAAEEV
jgi:DNA-binding NtrC family response regulator